MADSNVFYIGYLSDEEMDEIWHYNTRWFKVHNMNIEHLKELEKDEFEVSPNLKYSDYSIDNDCVYLQTYGGGEEGGFIISNDGSIFEVNKFKKESPFHSNYLGKNQIELKTDGHTIYCRHSLIY